MKRIGLAGSLFVAALAISVVTAMSASATPPEFGRCVKVAKGTGEYFGARCLTLGSGGSYDWLPGAEKKAFKVTIEEPVITSSGKSKTKISCPFGHGEAEYTGPKTVKIKSLVYQDCRTPELSPGENEIKLWCQNLGSFRGEVTTNELIGELGYITATTKVGLDVKPATGSSLGLFECGGANETTERGMGTGTFRELTGSVIGRVKKINTMLIENATRYEAKKGVQVPTQLEGGTPDTLSTLVGLEKTAEPTTYSTVEEVKSEEPIEVKSK